MKPSNNAHVVPIQVGIQMYQTQMCGTPRARRRKLSKHQQFVVRRLRPQTLLHRK